MEDYVKIDLRISSGETESGTTESGGTLHSVLDKYGGNQLERQLLLFWGMHPYAKFSRFAVGYAVDGSRLGLERVLRDMIEAGLLDTQVSNGETLYSLTLDEEKRRPVLELARLGWDRWSGLLRGGANYSLTQYNV